MTLRSSINTGGRACTALLLSLIIVSAGCSKRESKPDVVTLEGKVESIERSSDDTGTITVRYYNNEHEKELVGTGGVTPQTEILIDGAAATLADIRVGDRVRGDVRVEKIGGERVQTAIRIHVERPK